MKQGRKNSILEDKMGKVFLIQDSHCEKVLVILGSVREINFFKRGLEINTEFNMVIKAINGFDFFMMKSLVILVDSQNTLSKLYQWAAEFLSKYNLEITLDVLNRLIVTDQIDKAKKEEKRAMNGIQDNHYEDCLPTKTNCDKLVEEDKTIASGRALEEKKNQKQYGVRRSFCGRNTSVPPSLKDFSNNVLSNCTLNDIDQETFTSAYRDFQDRTYTEMSYPSMNIVSSAQRRKTFNKYDDWSMNERNSISRKYYQVKYGMKREYEREKIEKEEEVSQPPSQKAEFSYSSSEMLEIYSKMKFKSLSKKTEKEEADSCYENPFIKDFSLDPNQVSTATSLDILKSQEEIIEEKRHEFEESEEEDCTEDSNEGHPSLIKEIMLASSIPSKPIHLNISQRRKTVIESFTSGKNFDIKHFYVKPHFSNTFVNSSGAGNSTKNDSGNNSNNSYGSAYKDNKKEKGFSLKGNCNSYSKVQKDMSRSSQYSLTNYIGNGESYKENRNENFNSAFYRERAMTCNYTKLEQTNFTKGKYYNSKRRQSAIYASNNGAYYQSNYYNYH